MQMDSKCEIVLLASLPPIKARKLTYYSDRNFIARVGSLPLPPARELPPLAIAAPIAPSSGLSAPGGRARAQDMAQPLPQRRDQDASRSEQTETANAPAGTVREQMARYFMQFGADRDFPT